jgi:hypothetical protein
MLQNQLSRYKAAVGRPNIGSKVSPDEIPSVASMNRSVDSISRRTQNEVSMGKARATSSRNNSLATAANLTKSRPIRSSGSMAGYKGGRSSWIQMNGGGYSGSSRRSSQSLPLGSASAGVIASSGLQGSRNGMGPMYAKSSKDRLQQVTNLNRMV